MAEGSFSWVFELMDKVSAPARGMNNALEHLMHTTESVEKALKGLVIVEVLEKAYELTEGLRDRMMEFADEAIRAADYERTALISFSALTGSHQGGEEMMGAAKDFALRAGTDLKATMAQFAQLRLGGVVDPTNIAKLVAVANDIQVKSFGQRSASSIVQTFAEIQSRAQLTGRSLAAFAGVLPFDVLAKKLGVTSGSFHELQETLNKTPVSAAKGIRAIVETMAGASKSVGNTQEAVGMGWEGSINKMRTSWELMLGSLQETSAFGYLLDIINRVAKALDPATESGKRVKEMFEKAFTAAGNFLEPLTKPGGIEKVITTLTNLGDAVAGVARAFSLLAGLMSDSRATKELGKSAAQGFATGMAHYATHPMDAAIDLATNVYDAMAGPKGIDAHSPSKKTMQLGRYMTDGLREGMRLGDFANQVRINLPKSGGGQRQGAISIPITIHASTSDAKGLADKARDVVVSALSAAFEEIAVESGAS